MSLRVYNTLSRTKEVFEPITPGKVGMYLCGPTVYASPHIGHLVGPIIFDAMKRYLVYKGFDVTLVINLTDVDDKLIVASHEQNRPVTEIAAQYTDEYLKALWRLGINSVDRFPKVSEHIPDIIALIEKLVNNGKAYFSDGNVWFDVSKDSQYGRLSGRSPNDAMTGTRETEGGGKRSPADFALWKSAKPGEPEWQSPWGRGRPGWHIECSAMSMKYLGETFDIHGGGDDLKFPHHENELAQSEGATGKVFARFWCHNGLTRMRTKSKSGEWKEEKMSKSTGNVVSIDKVISAHGPQLVKYLILSTHYRSPIDFSDETVVATKKGLNGFERILERANRLGIHVTDETPDVDRASRTMLEGSTADFIRALLGFKMRWLEMMDDDFNTAGAIAVMHEIIGATNAYIDQTKIERERNESAIQAVGVAVSTLEKLAGILGLTLAPSPAEHRSTDSDGSLTDDLMKLLIEVRNRARTTKQFEIGDAVRNGLKKLGITLEDNQNGTSWKRDSEG
ncbi:MAG TPA: cysteine--tRNA ligase [Tepidisphaeraceae bacterium]|nr:cysteine--tRNA ligase [Tepidisphaeraceae bacterium]